MVINGKYLWSQRPIVNGIPEKKRFKGVSYGLTEAGYDIRIDQTVVLHPLKRFQLASAMEQFNMPANMVGIVHDKSTWARKGLSVFNTVIEPGWYGYLTLELVYHGYKPLRIERGSGIAQVLFHEVMVDAQYKGKYQGQKREPVNARFDV